MKRLIEVQNKLKAPKGNYNSFGNYRYRSCEDILEAVKPLLKEQGLLLTLSDDIKECGGKNYIVATATVRTSDGVLAEVKAMARESADKKKMDDSQMTGTASSYARKYALNGLFLIDDTKDADTDEYAITNGANSKVEADYRNDVYQFYKKYPNSEMIKKLIKQTLTEAKVSRVNELPNEKAKVLLAILKNCENQIKEGE